MALGIRQEIRALPAKARPACVARPATVGKKTSRNSQSAIAGQPAGQAKEHNSRTLSAKFEHFEMLKSR
jgi:hypothetical protein